METSRSPKPEPMEYEELRTRLEEAEETLRAIRGGEVDALVVTGDRGDQIFTLKDASHPYQVMVEEMNEGALTLSSEGTVLYCNARFSEIVGLPMQKILGQSLRQFIAPHQRTETNKLLKKGLESSAKGALELLVGERLVPIEISIRGLTLDGLPRLTALVSDISERVRAEETIRLQAGQYATLLATSTDGFWIHDDEGRILDVNEAYCRMTGYSRQEMLHSTVAQMDAQATPRQVRGRMAKIARDGFGRFETQHRTKTGGLIDVEVSSTSFRPSGNFIVFIHDITDRKQRAEKLENYQLNLEEMVAERTAELEAANAHLEAEIAERKRIEADLRASEEKALKQAAELDAIISSLPGAVTIYNKRGRPIRMNKLSDDFRGYTETNEKASHLEVRTESGEPLEFHSRPAQRALAGELVQGEILQIRNGMEEPLWISSSACPIYKDGALSGAVEIVTDITSIKVMEEELMRSEKKFRELVKYAPVGIYQIDFRTRKFISVNEVVCEQTGYTREELLTMTPFDILDKESQAVFAERIHKWLAGEEPPENVEYHVIGKDGREIYATLNVTFTRDEHGAPLGATVVGYDITERKRAEAETHMLLAAVQSEKDRLSALVENISDEIWFANAEKKFTLANPAALKAFLVEIGSGLDVETFAASLEVFRPDGSPRPLDEAPPLRALRGEFVSNQQEIIRIPSSGELRHREVSATPVRDADGRVIGSVAIVRDITERMQAEKTREELLIKLEQQTAELNSVFDSVPVGLSIMDTNGKVIRINHAGEEILGLRSSDLAASVRERFGQFSVVKADGTPFPQDQSPTFRALRGDRVIDTLQVIQRGDDRQYLNVSAAPIQSSDGTLFGAVTSFEDITGRKRAEQEIARARLEAEQRAAELEVIMEAVPVGMMITRDREGMVITGNRAAHEMLRVPLDEPNISKSAPDPDDQRSYKPVRNGVPVSPEDLPIQAAARGEQVRDWDCDVVFGNGDVTHIIASGTPLYDEKGEPRGAVAAFIDVTERRRAEYALRDSEERYRQLVELSPDAIFVNRQNKIALVNRAALELFGARSASQLLGKSPFGFFHRSHQEQIAARMQTLFAGGALPVVDMKIIRLDGTVRTAEVAATLITEAEGPAAQVILRDVTERNLGEGELKRLNRTLKALSNINQAMVHDTDELSYMEDVCRIVVEDCGHAMVWIGLAQEDKAKSVKPVANAGFEEGYLDTLKITWADTARGRGPTGSAIRLGEARICRNMLTDPAFKPWRKEAVKRGYASSVSLPLASEGKAFGALTIYSRQPDPFSESEMELLGELASDLAYGITMLRTRKAHEQAEEALRQSEARFRQLADASFEGLVIHENGLLLDINTRMTEILGYAPEEVIGKKFWEFIEPKYHPVVREKVQKGSPELYEVELIHKDGRRVPVEVVGRPLLWKGRQVRVSALSDITERRRSEAALRESEARYRSLFNGMSEGFALHEAIWDEEGKMVDYRFLDLNPAFEEFTGLKREKVIGHTYNEILPGDSPRWMEVYGKVTHTGEPVHFDNYSPILQRHYDIRAYRPAPGQFAAIFMDITEQKGMEESLRVNLAKYATLFESFPLGITVSDQEGRILETNQEAAKLLGIPGQEQLRRTLDGSEWKLIRADGSEFPPAEYASVRALNEHRRIENQEMGIVKKGGQVTWITVTAAPLPVEGYGVVVTYGDITERKRLENELRRTRAEAEQRANELNTVFNSIKDGIVVYDSQGRARQANRVAEEILGFDPADKQIGELANKLSSRTMDGELLRLADAPTTRALSGQTVSGERYLIRTPRETDRIILSSSTPLWVGERIAGAVTVLQDVSEQYRAEETQAWLASFPELNPNPVTEMDETGKLYYVNPASRQLFPDLESKGKDHPWLNGLETAIQDFKQKSGLMTFREVQVGQATYVQSVSIVPQNGRVRTYGFEITKRKRAEKALERSNERLALISDTVSQLLASSEPQQMVEELVRKVLDHLDCQVSFNYLVDEEAGRLHLNACAGIPQKMARRIEWLDFGQMVCGRVARDGQRIVAEDIPATKDPRTDLVRGFGVQAYACHPLMVQGKVIGTLSFGTRTRTHFSEDDLSLMKTITDHVAIAMGRRQAEVAVIQARDELEGRVLERTRELSSANQQLGMERQRFNDVLNDLPAYLILLTPDYRVAFANRYFEERFGKSDGRRCYEYLFNRTEPCEICDTFRTLRDNQPQRWEWAGPDQRDYDVHAFPFTDVDGSRLILEMGIDITKRKHAETELEKYRQHLEELVRERTTELANERANLQKIFDVVNVGMLLVDEGGGVKRINDVIRRWTGRKEGDLGSLQPGDALGCIHALGEPGGCGHTPYCSTCRIRQAFESVLRTGQPEHGMEINSTVLHEGEQKNRWFDISADPLEVDGQRNVILALSDITARKEAEQALRQAHAELEIRVEQRTEELHATNDSLLAAQARLESERRKYQNLFDFAPIIYVATDTAGTISEANKAAQKLLTSEHNSVYGSDLAQFMPEADRSTFIHWLYQLQQVDGLSDREISLRLPEGETRQVSINVSRVINPQNGKTDLHWLIADISERKQAEAQLRLQTSAMEAAANGIIITDSDGTIQWCNPAFEQVSGYSPEEVVGLNPRFLKSGKHNRAFYKNMWQTLLSGQVWRGEMVNKRKTGELYIEEEIITPVRDERNQISHFIAIKQDITSRKEAEEALRLANAYNRSLIEASLDPIATVTPAGKIGDVNSATEKMTGRSRLELIGTDFHEYFSDPARARQAYQKAFETGSVHDYELEIRHKAGHVTPVLYNASVYRDERNAVQGAFAVARDITDRRQFEAQLMQAEKHAVIGRMVGSVTHEINNPLQTIKNCLYLIKQDTPADSSVAEPLDMAASETARLANLVAQLRELYRPSTDVRDHPYELQDIIEEVHALLTPHLNNSQVQWNQLTGLKRCYINGVRDQILEVFLNISMNAIEAMKSTNGILSVDMAFKEEKVGVIFRDTGPGVAVEMLPHIFEPFQTTKSSGLGLGLSISYGIIQRHGGQIVAENNPEGGAAFTVWLPLGRKNKKENKTHAIKR